MVEDEPPLEPERKIIDPHLHLWEIQPAPGQTRLPRRLLFDECREMVAAAGHAITHTIFVECGQMYRDDGPAHLRSLGETEFVNGIAAMSASGGYGACRIAHRIVSSVDLRGGDAVHEALEGHRAAAGERFRGVRMPTAWSANGMFGFPPDPAGREVMRDPRFIAGAHVLAAMGLSLDVWCVHTQLQELIELADAVPDLTIVLDHCGTLDSQGSSAERRDEALTDWAALVLELSRRPNVVVKLGGLGMKLDRPIGIAELSTGSEELADRWRPMLEHLIECFGPDRCMFESNFPPDRDTASYGATWNAFKRVAAPFSENEKDALFRRTAARVYNIAL